MIYILNIYLFMHGMATVTDCWKILCVIGKMNVYIFPWGAKGI